jgi:hypothetical protein
MPAAIGTFRQERLSSLLQAMADNIAFHGHYQGQGQIGGRCCLVLNPAFTAAGIGARRTVVRLLAPKANYALTYWNDNTPTAEVISTLRHLANDLTEVAA